MEAERLKRFGESGPVEVIGDDAGTRCKAGFDIAWHGQPEVRSFLGEQSSGDHHARNGWVVVPTLLAVVVLALGTFKLKASVKLQNRFASRTKIIADYHWLENRLGPLVPMEVEIRFDPSVKLSRWQQMQVVQSIERTVKRSTAVNATLVGGNL